MGANTNYVDNLGYVEPYVFTHSTRLLKIFKVSFNSCMNWSSPVFPRDIWMNIKMQEEKLNNDDIEEP